MTLRADRMRIALTHAFPAAEVAILDDSAQHAGHAGAAPGGQTHFSLRLVSPAFAGLSRVARARAVHQVLEAEFGGGLHALSLRLLAPGEPGAEAKPDVGAKPGAEAEPGAGAAG